MTTNNQDLDQAAKNTAPASMGQETSAPARASRRRITNDGAANPADLIAAAVPADEMAAKFSKRRRFIKVGATSIPVALTLTSQPVMAWQCNSTSAWGSGMMQHNTGSVKARNEATRVKNDCYSFNDWKTNNRSCWSHSNLGCSEAQPSKIDTSNASKFDNCVGWSWNADATGKMGKTNGYLKGNFNNGKTLACSHLGVNTSVMRGDAKVYELLNTGSKFQQCMAVAMLNEKCFPSTVGACLKTGTQQQSALAAMATGEYYPVPGVRWGEAEIMKYLADNYIVA